MSRRGSAHPSIADRIADWAASLTLDGVPSPAIETAKRCLVDVCGVAAAGSAAPVAQSARGYSQANFAAGPCFAFAAERRLAAPGAAFVNAATAHALDYDDTCYVGMTHPSAVVFPAAVAAAEAAGASGRDLLAGFVAGVEVEAALGGALGLRFYEKGWFCTAALGTVGAVAAAARARALDPETTRQAVRLAAVQMLGLRAVLGTTAKPLTAGRASEIGVSAVELAMRGAEGPADALEGPGGFIRTANDGEADLAALEALGQDFVLERPGIAFKLYPVCSAAQPAAELTGELLDALQADGAAVRSVLCEVTPFVESCLLYHVPASVTEMQFSLPFAVACVLTHGTIAVGHLNLATLQDPGVGAALPKVEMRRSEALANNPETRDRYPEAAIVTVTLEDGRSLQRTKMAATGMPDVPLGDAALDRKFLDCAMTLLPEAAARDWLACIRGVEDLTAISEIFTAVDGAMPAVRP